MLFSHRLSLYLALLLSLAPIAAAQPSLFETLDVSVGGVGTFGDAPYTDFWDPGPGVEGRVETPFYLGRVAVGGMIAPHAAVEGVAVPDYLSLYFFGVWTIGVPLPGGLRLAPGVQVGLFEMQFDADDVASVNNEAELAAGPEVWLSASVGQAWRVRAGAGAVRIFTAERIDFRFVRVGVSRTLRTPGWLRDFLR